jgi:exonuclease SbcC
MIFSQLVGIDIANFRSIRGRIHAPLDAKVVLVNGENGAGKTSLLSAIELALTGRVDALRRADPNYYLQLLNKKAVSGFAEVAVSTENGQNTYRTEFSAKNVSPVRVLGSDAAEFFGERAYLPQSLLSQLLYIYQESGSDVSSPLARFVSKLLGLDRLDAIEAGLKPLGDVRNVRKIVDRWSSVEIEKSRLIPLIKDRRQARTDLENDIRQKRSAVVAVLGRLGATAVNPAVPEQYVFLSENVQADESALARVTDQVRELASVRRDIARQVDDAGTIEAQLSDVLARSAANLEEWRGVHQVRVAELRDRIVYLFPQETLPSDLSDFYAEAMRLLRVEQSQMADRAARGQEDAKALANARDQLEVANKQLNAIDAELSEMSSDAGRLSSLLAEISSFIMDDVCPVCGRDYSEEEAGNLVDRVHARTRELSSSADRLVSLGRSRSEHQAAANRLQQTIGGLAARQVDEEALSDLDRRTAAVEAALTAVEPHASILEEGQRLILAEIAARRQFSEAQQRSGRRLAIGETLAQLAAAIGIEMTDDETIEAFADRLDLALSEERRRLDVRIRSRAAAQYDITAIDAALAQMKTISAEIAGYEQEWDRNDKALQRAQAMRSSGIQLRNAVDVVRSDIIRREFNERLNRLWRDIFVRLAPSEEFVPAFRIPDADTQRLQPKLYTPHRDLGDEIAGGTPGAMLSAGNLNTAALTLFIALHLSVPVQLPWLILDDPVQSMDDIHIAHFAALLRTLSKEHDRQVIIAVHDRQLFEYLRLELSPAFPDDSLITLELTRSIDRDSHCFSTRYSFQEETALRAA